MIPRSSSFPPPLPPHPPFPAPLNLPALLLNGDFFLATTLAAAMAKLVLRVSAVDAAAAATLRQAATEVLVAIVAYGQRPFIAVIPSIPVSAVSQAARPHKCLTEVVMGPDDLERICICFEAMENPTDLTKSACPADHSLLATQRLRDACCEYALVVAASLVDMKSGRGESFRRSCCAVFFALHAALLRSPLHPASAQGDLLDAVPFDLRRQRPGVDG